MSFAVLALATRFVHAAEPSAAEIANARRLFTEATALEDRGQWAEAAQKLSEAIAIKETPGLRYHLAFAKEQMALLTEALSDYERAAELLDGGARAPDVAKLVGPARDRVRQRVPTILINLPADVEGAALNIDHRPIDRAATARPIALNAGVHHVTISAPGRESLELDVRLAEGERQTLDPEFPPKPSSKPASEPAVSPAPSATPPSSAAATLSARQDPGTAVSSGGTSDTLRTVVLASGAAVTVAALGLGVGYTLRKNAADNRVRDAQTRVPREPDACTRAPQPAACGELSDAADDYEQAAGVARIAFISAGVGAVATVVTFFVWPASEPSRVSVAGGATPGGGFLALRGAF